MIIEIPSRPERKEMTREEYFEKLHKLNEEREKQTKAAIQIQRYYRGFLARSKYELMKKKHSYLVYRKNFKIKDDLVNLRINRVPSLNEYYTIASSYYKNINTSKLIIPKKLIKAVKTYSDLINYVKLNHVS